METLNTLSFWQGFLLGIVLGFLAGMGVMAIFKKMGFKKEELLAWTIGVTWFVWHVAAGFTGIVSTPPSMFDIVSGGAVGFIFGEKFFEYIASAVKSSFNRK